MAWTVTVAKPAQKQVAKFPAKDQGKIGAAVASMADNPFSGDVLERVNQVRGCFQRSLTPADRHVHQAEKYKAVDSVHRISCLHSRRDKSLDLDVSPDQDLKKSVTVRKRTTPP